MRVLRHALEDNMRNPKGHPCHECAPAEWRHTPDLTGSFELDEVIRKNANRNIPARLEYYLAGFTAGRADSLDENVYGPRTGYNGYSGYHGDD